VLEVIAPGLLVVKYPHGGSGKFVNVAVLEGDQAKVVDESPTVHGFEAPAAWSRSANLFVRLAVSMRAHGRGGSLLVVPAESERWRKSIVQTDPVLRLAALSPASPSCRSRIWSARTGGCGRKPLPKRWTLLPA
jgi:hypothetical protein